MRSARVAIATVALSLVLLPFGLLLIAWVYERAIISAYGETLERVAEVAAVTPSTGWEALAKQEGVWLRRVRPDGVDDFGVAKTAMFNSAIGGVVEEALKAVGADTPFESLAAVDAEAPREGGAGLTSRASDSGQTVVVTLVRPLGDGSTLLAVRGNHRGVRQLLLARRQLAKLVLYQLVFAVLSALLLARWLVKPLERLTARAQAYPAHEIAEPALLARRDEVGQLSRAFTGLTKSLEARRQETVDLAADIAHELKNPLAAISAASELIANTADASPEKRARVHGVILDSVERLRATTDALLSLVRLESTLGGAARDRFDYAAWLDALLETYRQQHPGFTFEVAANGIGEVELAGEGWASLMRNLLDNAVVHSQRVRVRARREGSTLVTEVTDFGPGVSEGNREKVFQRFFTARPEGVARGTGLGLAIVRAVAEAHRGTVELLPRVEGEGATFRVSVPAVGPAVTVA